MAHAQVCPAQRPPAQLPGQVSDRRGCVKPSARKSALELSGDLQGAALAWVRLDCPYDAALAQLASDDPSALGRALETFESLGAYATAARARARLRELGVRTGQRGPRSSTRADSHGLTARQREIFDLVAEGLTDTQIAARLHLSAKTVNHHVGAVLTKLDVHTRAEAVRKLRTRERGGAVPPRTQ